MAHRGLTLDTGALIALERRDRRALSLVTQARKEGRIVTIPAPVLLEWWRGPRERRRYRYDPSGGLIKACNIEPLDERLARIAGEALARLPKGPSTTDATVMASAAQRGDIVLTSDFEDLDALTSVFPDVRIIRV